MLSLDHLDGKGMTDYEIMSSIAEAVQENMIKNRLGKLLIDEDKMDELFETMLPSHEQQTKAIEILTTLSKRERQCFLMHTVGNISMQKIADELGLSKGSVNQYIIRARKKLKQTT